MCILRPTRPGLDGLTGCCTRIYNACLGLEEGEENRFIVTVRGHTKGRTHWLYIPLTCFTWPSRPGELATVHYGIDWQAQEQLGNTRTTHGNWSLHVGFTTAGIPWTLNYSRTNQARSCVTWSIGRDLNPVLGCWLSSCIDYRCTGMKRFATQISSYSITSNAYVTVYIRLISKIVKLILRGRDICLDHCNRYYCSTIVVMVWTGFEPGTLKSSGNSDISRQSPHVFCSSTELSPVTYFDY